MAEYIERDAVMQKFADRVKPSNNSDFVSVPTWNEAVQIVEDFPAADVVERCKGHKCPEQKRGKWINVLDIGTVCNQCGYDIEVRGYDILTDGEPNFCPNCGADMREES